MPNPASLIADYLSSHHLPYEVFHHEAVFTCDEAEDRYTEQGVPNKKSLVLRNKKKTKFWMCTVPGDQRTDLKALGEILGDRVSFASPEQLQELLRVTPGSCSPFGLIFDTDHRVEFWIEESLLRHPALGFHPNDNTQTWKVSAETFQRFIESLGRPLHTLRF